MSPKDFLRRFKRAIFPAVTAGLEAYGEQLLELGHKFMLQQKPLRRSHLHNLEKGVGLKPDQIVVGYALERAARKLNPRVTGGDLSRPTLCMVCIGDEYARIVEAGTQSKINYCKRHGYNLAILETPPYRYDRHPAWLRIPLLFRLMQMGHGRLFYLDADSLITNPDILLEDFFVRLEKSDRHLMIAEDVYSLNTGSFFLRKTWQSLTLLDLVYESDTRSNHGCWEQQTLIDLVEEHPVVRALLYLETHARRFNGMPFERRSPGLPSDCSAYAWQPGDFICHLAGTRSKDELASQMQKFHRLTASAQSASGISKLEGTGK